MGADTSLLLVEEIERTDSAVLLKSKVTGVQAWVPYAQIRSSFRNDDGSYRLVEVPNAVLERKKLR